MGEYTTGFVHLGRLPGNLSWPSRVTDCEAEVSFPNRVQLSSPFSSASEVMEEDIEWVKKISLWSHWDFGDVCYCGVACPDLNKIVSPSIYSVCILRLHSFLSFSHIVSQLDNYFFNYVQFRICPFLVFILLPVLFFPAFTTLSSA